MPVLTVRVCRPQGNDQPPVLARQAHHRGQMTTSIYMVERADRPGEYRRVSRAVANRDAYVFEGVDGDEEADTVTYWHRRKTKDDPE